MSLYCVRNSIQSTTIIARGEHLNHFPNAVYVSTFEWEQQKRMSKPMKDVNIYLKYKMR